MTDNKRKKSLMFIRIPSRRKIRLGTALSIGLLIMVCASAWLWSRRSDLSSVYIVTAAGPLDRVAFSPNGQVVATAAVNGTIQLWRAADGSPLHTLRGRVGPVAIAFHPDSTQLVSAGEDGSVQLWQVASGQSLQTLWPPAQVEPAPAVKALVRHIRADDPFSAVTFSPDG
jgi:WD40 repeat protein